MGGDEMTIPQKIKMALAYKGMKEAELARALETSPSALPPKRFPSLLVSKERKTFGVFFFTNIL